ncbi:MAG: acyltransferase [Desulfobacterales bacterium]|nr:acyltransferase [Desulfobacterales bacterium]
MYRTTVLWMRGTIAFVWGFTNTIVCCIPFFTIAILKLIIPITVWKKGCSKALIEIASSWIFINSFGLKLLHHIHWEVEGLEELSNHQWYIVISNHQSWTDIIVLQTIFYRKIPFLKFFLKKELIWVPLLGLVWWALDYPFMKRYSRTFIEKNPHLKGKDIEITRKACEKFKQLPVSIMNFVEGTRFTPEKYQKQRSPYANLLKPKAGGIAFVLAAMGEQLNSILNVTIVYPEGTKNIWNFLCGEVRRIKVHIEIIPITADLLGDYFEDANFQKQFQEWVNQIWIRKDQRIYQMLGVPQELNNLGPLPSILDCNPLNKN